MMQSIKINKNRWCVYMHHIGDVVFYVGMGSPLRAFSPLCRNEKWKEIVKKHEYFEISIIAEFKDRQEAINFENDLIGQIKPLANIQGIKNNVTTKKIPRKKLKVFRSEIDKIKEFRKENKTNGDIRIYFKFGRSLFNRLCAIADEEIEQEKHIDKIK